MARYNRIFAALDGSDAQVAVARRTLSIAHDNNAEVLFGHVIDTSKFETCVPSVKVKVAMGPLNDTMMDGLIKPFNPDLVICGVRGLSNIRYAFVGSVSTHIVRHAPCDVLVVRPEAIDELPEEEYAPYEID